MGTLDDFKAAKQARNEARTAHAEAGLTVKKRATRLKALNEAESALSLAAAAQRGNTR